MLCVGTKRMIPRKVLRGVLLGWRTPRSCTLFCPQSRADMAQHLEACPSHHAVSPQPNRSLAPEVCSGGTDRKGARKTARHVQDDRTWRWQVLGETLLTLLGPEKVFPRICICLPKFLLICSRQTLRFSNDSLMLEDFCFPQCAVCTAMLERTLNWGGGGGVAKEERASSRSTLAG